MPEEQSASRLELSVLVVDDSSNWPILVVVAIGVGVDDRVGLNLDVLGVEVLGVAELAIPPFDLSSVASRTGPLPESE